MVKCFRYLVTQDEVVTPLQQTGFTRLAGNLLYQKNLHVYIIQQLVCSPNYTLQS